VDDEGAGVSVEQENNLNNFVAGGSAAGFLSALISRSGE
jgi:hypothetical protein